jgi:hypothetical protein
MNIQVSNTDGHLRVVQNGRVRFYNIKSIKSVDSLYDTNNDYYLVINFIANDKENALNIYLKDITNQATWTNTSAGAEVAKGVISGWMQDTTIVSGTVSLSTSTLTALENITVQNPGGASAVNIQDGGNSITVDGTVELGATTLSALESVTVQNPAGASAVNIQDGGNSITIDATALPLPTGAATEATLSDVKTSVQLIDNCVGTDNTTAPANSFVVAGVTAAGVQQTIEVNASGHVHIADGGGSITVDSNAAIRTPTILRTTANSMVSPGVYSASFASVGTANATVGGIILKPGETINFDAGGINNTLAAITYDASTAGAELLIIILA